VKKSKRKQLIKKLLKSDMGFFATPSKDRRIVIDVINELHKKDITVTTAKSVLIDAAKVIDFITKV